jgi:AcrR family transcriptional regulator
MARGRPPSIREEDILDAARDVFREEGHAATTARIAERAGISEGIIFYRFKSREALLAAVIHRETQPPAVLHRMAESAGRRTLGRNLDTIVNAILDSGLRAHPFFELAETSPTSQEIRRALFSAAAKPPPQVIVELIAGYLEAEMRLGRVRAVDPIPIARAIFGACVDFVRAGQFPGCRGDRPAFVRGLVDLLVHGTQKPVEP